MQEKRGQPDILRIMALFICFLLIVYSWLFIFMPRAIPSYLRTLIPSEKIFILAMGVDYDYDQFHNRMEKGRTDALMLIEIDPFSYRINLVSIPRDSYVEIPGHGKDKINAAYALGQEQLAMETVSALLNINIEKYVIMNPSGIQDLVDGLGGIKVYVDKDMYYRDRWGGLKINLKKGLQKLNGKQAEGFVRFRHEALGDISRVQRQQGFLKILFRKLASPLSLARLPWLVPAVQSSIKTNLTFTDIMLIANFARMTDPKDIRTETLPGNFSEEGSPVSYWLPNLIKKDILFKELKIN